MSKRTTWLTVLVAAAVVAYVSAVAARSHDTTCPYPPGSQAAAPFVFVDVPEAATPRPALDAVGCASVAGGRLTWVLLDDAGAVLDQGEVVASCGTGCVAPFTLHAAPPSDALETPTVVTLEVFATGPGEVLHHLSRIPVALEAEVAS